MVYLQTDCLKTDVKYGTNRKEDVMFNGNMRVSQPHADVYKRQIKGKRLPLQVRNRNAEHCLILRWKNFNPLT